MDHRENPPATWYHFLEFYHRLWIMSADGRVCSRAGCPAWVCPRFLFHGPTPILPYGRGGSLHARPWISAEDLDSSEILGDYETESARENFEVRTRVRRTVPQDAQKVCPARLQASRNRRRTLGGT